MSTPPRTGLGRLWYVASWRARYWWHDTRAGQVTRVVVAVLQLVALCAYVWQDLTAPRAPDEPVRAIADWIVYAIMFVVSVLVSYALAPKPPNAKAQKVQVPVTEDGAALRRIYGPVRITDPTVIAFKHVGTDKIRKRAGKSLTLKTKWQTVGHHYKHIMQFLLGRGVLDAVLDLRGADKVMWQGEMTSSGALVVRKPKLWGGEDSEGGVEGDFEIMLGHQDQMPSAYLAANLSPDQSAFRGRPTITFKGGRWGNSPYPKPLSVLVTRIFRGWDDDDCWYPEKAAVPVIEYPPSTAPWVDAVDPRNAANGHEYRFGASGLHPWRATLEEAMADGGVAMEEVAAFFGWSADGIRLARVFGGDPNAHETLLLHFNRYGIGDTSQGAAGFADYLPYGPSSGCGPLNLAGVEVGGARFWWSGINDLAPGSAGIGAGLWRVVPYTEYDAHESFINNCTAEPGWPPVDGFWPQAVVARDILIRVRRAGGSVLNAMNLAHVLYDSLTAQEMDGEPRALINEASWRAAADRLYDEGFGIGTEYVSSTETIEQLQQRLCNLAAARMSTDPTTGEWHLDLIRSEVPDDILVITDDDVLEFEEQPSILDEAVNQVVVRWTDLRRNQVRSTAPLQAVGAIQAFGAVNGEVNECPELLSEAIALRVAERNLAARATPLKRHSLRVTRVAYGQRPGRKARLQLPKHGIADMVVVLGDINRGTLRSGAIALTTVQDVAAMPETTYVGPEPGDPAVGGQEPLPSPAVDALELPYLVLRANEGAAAEQLPASQGYLGALAAPPQATITQGYRLFARTGAGEFEEAADGEQEWAAGGELSADLGRDDETAMLSGVHGAVTADDGTPLGMIGTGRDAELVGVVMMDSSSASIVRGVGDTVPKAWPAGTRVWVLTQLAEGMTEYAEGQAVEAKFVTVAAAAELEMFSAPTASVTMAARASRPYPPGRVQIGSDPSEPSPAAVTGQFEVTWAMRNRLTQADQLYGHGDEVPGDPAVDYRYALRLLDGSGTLLIEKLDIGSTAALVDLAYTGAVTLQLYAIDDNGESWQRHVRTFDYTSGGAAEHAITAATWDLPAVIIDGGKIE